MATPLYLGTSGEQVAFARSIRSSPVSPSHAGGLHRRTAPVALLASIGLQRDGIPSIEVPSSIETQQRGAHLCSMPTIGDAGLEYYRPGGIDG